MSDNRAVAGVNIGHLAAVPEMLAEELREVIGFYVSGTVKPLVDAVVPFSQAATGVGRLRDGKNAGKVMLVPDGASG